MEAKDGIWDKVMGAKKSGFDEGKREGIREVVEWIKLHSPIFIAGADIALCAGHEMKHDISYYPVIKWLEWQAKLKDWNLEGGK